MRVGVIGPMDLDSFADNVFDCLESMGIDAVHLGTPRPVFRLSKLSAAYDFAARALPAIDERVQSSLAKKAVEYECDLVISTQSEILPGTVADIRAAGIPIVLWFPDAVSNLGRQLMFAADYSRLYMKDPLLVERVGSVTGKSVAYLPEACNPRWHKPDEIPYGTKPGMVLAGNMYPTRVLLLNRLISAGVPLRLYGAGFPSWMPKGPAMNAYQNEFVVRSDKAQVFRQATAVLNNLHPSELTSVNCRLFEAAGSGAAVITEYRPALNDLFDVGSEVLAFSNFDELMGHWQDLASDPELGAKIGHAAAVRAVAEHTYQHRLRVILEDVA